MDSAYTGPDGTYQLRGLRPGTYRVCFHDYVYPGVYAPECYNDARIETAASG